MHLVYPFCMLLLYIHKLSLQVQHDCLLQLAVDTCLICSEDNYVQLHGIVAQPLQDDKRMHAVKLNVVCIKCTAAFLSMIDIFSCMCKNGSVWVCLVLYLPLDSHPKLYISYKPAAML